MTIACSECNRRKLDYYDPACMFLDPNTDNVEDLLKHLGPIVYNNHPGDKRSEVTVNILQLQSIKARKSLIGQKIEKLESIKRLIEHIADEVNPTMKNFLRRELSESCDISAEYSGMVKAYVESLPTNWDR